MTARDCAGFVPSSFDAEFCEECGFLRLSHEQTGIETVTMPCSCVRLPNHGKFVFFCVEHLKQIDDLAIHKLNEVDFYDFDNNDLPHVEKEDGE